MCYSTSHEKVYARKAALPTCGYSGSIEMNSGNNILATHQRDVRHFIEAYDLCRSLSRQQPKETLFNMTFLSFLGEKLAWISS